MHRRRLFKISVRKSTGDGTGAGQRPDRKEEEAESRASFCAPQSSIKGVSRRVIVVRPKPGARMFDEVIFVLNDDYLRTGGISEAELLREAREAAGEYVETII